MRREHAVVEHDDIDIAPDAAGDDAWRVGPADRRSPPSPCDDTALDDHL
jgi:hypothetical protein